MSDRMKNLAALGSLTSKDLQFTPPPATVKPTAVPHSPPAPVKTETTLGQPLPILIGRIQPFPGQPRRYFNRESLERLADSIQATGQEQPIKVCTNPKGGFTLIDGERRFRAHQIIEERTGKEPSILAFVEVVKNLQDHYRKSVIANLHREDLTDLDEATALQRLALEGMTIDELAATVGKSRSYVSNYIKLDGLPEVVKALMDPALPKAERLSTTAAIDIARSTSKAELRIELAKEIVERSLSLSDGRYLIQNRFGSMPDTPEAPRPEARHLAFQRKPSEEYLRFTMFISRCEKGAADFQRRLDIEALYALREDDTGDRKKDGVALRNAITQLQNLLDKVDPQ